jgi:hypothetical protein
MLSLRNRRVRRGDGLEKYLDADFVELSSGEGCRVCLLWSAGMDRESMDGTLQ